SPPISIKVPTDGLASAGEGAGSRRVVPGEKPQAVALRVLEPDLPVALGMILDRLADGEALVDQVPALAVEVGDLEDQADAPPRRGQMGLLDPLQPHSPAPGGQERELV